MSVLEEKQKDWIGVKNQSYIKPCKEFNRLKYDLPRYLKQSYMVFHLVHYKTAG